MSYRGGDDRHGGNNRYGSGDDQWREGGGQGRRMERERGSYGDWGGDRDRNRGDWGGRSQGDDDRGFFERAGEQVRSWFSDDDDDRGGRGYQDQYRREQSSNSSWGREDRNRDRGQGSGRGYAGGAAGSSWGGGGGGADTWGGSGFGGRDDVGRRFDRVDAGHVGSQGAHPMSAPVDSGYGYGAGGGAGGGSSARSAAIMAQARGGGHGNQQQGMSRQGGGYGGSVHDQHYSEWRNRQISELDRDYDEYRREHQSRFEQEFGGWRQKRQTQRQHMGRVTEHMEVLGSDGQRVGTVDKVKGDRIMLTKNDENAGGVHHSIPCSWIDSVDERVTINKTADEAMAAWKEEEQSRALFEREDQGSDGPHMLNRSFSGTYSDRDK